MVAQVNEREIELLKNNMMENYNALERDLESYRSNAKSLARKRPVIHQFVLPLLYILAWVIYFSIDLVEKETLSNEIIRLNSLLGEKTGMMKMSEEAYREAQNSVGRLQQEKEEV